MRILVFGGNGMLGHKLVQQLDGQFDVWATVREPFAAAGRFGLLDDKRCVDNVDVKDLSQVVRAIEATQPDVVVNAVGVIKQVPDAAEPLHLMAVNSVFPKHLARLSVQYGFRLISVSTDCVFSGDTGGYSESDFAEARDLYGISKFLGEVTEGNCLTIRTSMIGRELGTQHSVVEWFLSNRGGKVKGYVNAIYTGFPTVVLSRIIADIINDHPDLRGLYHVSSEPISKFDLLGLLNANFAADVQIEPSGEYRIDRSLDSTLFRTATGFSPAPWSEMIAAMAADRTPYDSWGRSTAA